MSYYLDCIEVTAERLREVLGRKYYLVDAVENDIFHDVKMTVLERGKHEYVVLIAKVDIEGSYRRERVIRIQYGPGYKRTEARTDIYRIGEYESLSHSIVYRDWIVPSSSKLSEIMRRLF